VSSGDVLHSPVFSKQGSANVFYGAEQPPLPKVAAGNALEEIESFKLKIQFDKLMSRENRGSRDVVQ
jgi:hypothetical protein